MSLVLGFVSVAGFATIVACVSDSEAPAPAEDGGATDAGTSDSGTLADVDVPASPCETYCDDVLANCTGDLRAYDNREQCLKMCALIPVGKEGDKAVNSVECRIPFAKVGGSTDNCVKASAYGGNVCGSKCDVFCDLVAQHCLAGPLNVPAPYATKADCVEACDDMSFDPNGPEGPGQAVAGPDTLNCRMYHLILSLDDRNGHCPHVAVDSATCKSSNVDGGAAGGDDGGHTPSD